MEPVDVSIPAKQPVPSSVSVPPRKKPRIESAKLFDGKSEVIIVHHSEEYHLRITRNGKLILTK
jgi:hemin uptake protein HemP